MSFFRDFDSKKHHNCKNTLGIAKIVIVYMKNIVKHMKTARLQSKHSQADSRLKSYCFCIFEILLFTHQDCWVVIRLQGYPQIDFPGIVEIANTRSTCEVSCANI